MDETLSEVELLISTGWKSMYSSMVAYNTVIAGGIAGSFGKTMTAPVSRITILYQVTPHMSQDSLLKACSDVFRQQGFSSFWKGNLTSVIHRFPYSGINFAVYEKMKRITKEESVFGKLMCGATAGATACCVCYPFDIVRTRLAASLIPTNQNNINNLSTFHKPGIARLIMTIVREEGLFRGLYRGIGMSLVVAVPNIGISFAVYGTTKEFFMTCKSLPPDLFCDENGKFKFIGGFLSGSVSAVLSSLLTFPADTIRKRLQLGKDAVKEGIISELSSIIRLNGSVFGLYRGILPELLRVIPMAAITFSTYETVMKYLNE